MDRDIRISKALSYLLRHGAVKEHLSIDASGYVAVTEILAHHRIRNYKATLQDIQHIVDTNSKKRFSLKQENEVWYICANQGHSINVTEDSMAELTHAGQFPAKLFHGTYQSKIGSIRQTGLKRMGRNHIHLTDNLEYVRRSCDTLIYIDVARCLEDGVRFYKSANEVYLTSGIDGVLQPKYFAAVERRPDQTNAHSC